jgi:hypothetical protein
MYEPTLVEVPTKHDVARYQAVKVPVLDQGTEGACTGFGLATVVHFLLRTRRIVPETEPVSPRMLYEMAKRYDEWPGEAYAGSSARGAMKGWHKHGVCGERIWPYRPDRHDRTLTQVRAANAATRPLGAYYRVNHHDLVAMHAAITETGILFATASVHDGWNAVDHKTGRIPMGIQILGGHAFAIVAYDAQGFWIQNSWGETWGRKGLGHLSYDDWLVHGTDVWVGRLGVPVDLTSAEAVAIARSSLAGGSETSAQVGLRPHLISLGNDGRLRPDGPYGTNADEVRELFTVDLPRLTTAWKKTRLLLYAHGGLVPESSAIQRLADYRSALLKAEVYPVSFIWHSDYWSTLSNILEDALRGRRPEGFLDATKDFLLDRLDDGLEVLARAATGRAAWSEMKENALLASVAADGGARLAADEIAKLAKHQPLELHVVAHSAGSVFMAPLVELLTTRGPIMKGLLKGSDGYGLPIESVTLWAPGCTVDLFKSSYLPALECKAIRRLALYTLTDGVEQDDDCAHIYHKSLLYLVSHAFEDHARIPLVRPDGTAILGLEKFVRRDRNLCSLFEDGSVHEWIRSPNDAPPDTPGHATARHHGDFDDDLPTVMGTLQRILGSRTSRARFEFRRSPESQAERRTELISRRGRR